MGVTYQYGEPFGGSSNYADRIMHDETKTVKKKIDEMQEVLNKTNEELETKEESLDGYIFVSKSGNHVTLYSSDRNSLKNYTIEGWATLKIGTISEEYRPKRNMQFMTYVRNTSSGTAYNIEVLVDTDGSVYLYNVATGSTITFSQKGFSFSWDV